MGAPAWVGRSKVWDPPALIILASLVGSAVSDPLLFILVWIPLCAGVPFPQTSFFGFALLCSNPASTVVGVEYSFQMWARLSVSTAKMIDTKNV